MKLEIVVKALQKAGYSFLVGNYTRSPNGILEGDTVYIFSAEKLQPARDFNGGPATNFKVVEPKGDLPEPRHAVICKIEIVNNKVVFHANPNRTYKLATKIMAKCVGGSVSNDIQDQIHCWEASSGGEKQFWM